MHTNRLIPLMILLFVFPFLQARTDAKIRSVSNPSVGKLLKTESPVAKDFVKDSVFYISLEGNDTNPGTKDLPFKSFEAARAALRDAESEFKKIVVLPGDYFLSKTFELDTNDSGLFIEAEQAETVNIYGGQKIAGWKHGGNGFWYADLPDRMKDPAMAVKGSEPPVLDGENGLEEWPGKFQTLNREPSRLAASGTPVMVKLSYDKKLCSI